MQINYELSKGDIYKAIAEYKNDFEFLSEIIDVGTVGYDDVSIFLKYFYERCDHEVQKDLLKVMEEIIGKNRSN